MQYPNCLESWVVNRHTSYKSVSHPIYGHSWSMINPFKTMFLCFSCGFPMENHCYPLFVGVKTVENLPLGRLGPSLHPGRHLHSSHLQEGRIHDFQELGIVGIPGRGQTFSAHETTNWSDVIYRFVLIYQYTVCIYCLYIYIYVCTYIYIYTLFIYVYVCMYVYIVYIYICVCVCICTLCMYNLLDSTMFSQVINLDVNFHEISRRSIVVRARLDEMENIQKTRRAKRWKTKSNHFPTSSMFS